MSDAKSTTLHLILWPSLLTLAINIARVTAECTGTVTKEGGPSGALLGITWLVPLVAAWFATRLVGTGSAPRVPRAWLWALLLVLAVAGVMAWKFRDLNATDTSDEALNTIADKLLIITVAAWCGVIGCLFVWPRLAWTMLCYGLCARLGVMAITVLAIALKWDTHYTKLGPAGVTRDAATTLQMTAIAELGFWTGATILVGTLVGCLFAKRKRG